MGLLFRWKLCYDGVTKGGLHLQLKDIAKAAGVSQSAISIVRTGKPGVSADTRVAIQKLLRENGFDYAEYPVKQTFRATPHPGSTQYLRLIKFTRHAMLVDGNEGFVSSIIDALDINARRRGYHMFINAAGPDDLPAVVESVSTIPCDGVLVVSTEMEESDLRPLAALKVPAVLIDSDFVCAPYSSVTMNNREIAYQATQHLVDLGHRRIGYLCSSVDTSNFLVRTQGFLETLERNGIPFDRELCFPLRPTLTEAREDMLALLAQRRPLPTAFFAANDTIAIGAMKALREEGYSVPDDVSVVGVDNIPYSAVADPPLTTMNVCCASISRRAMFLLMHEIRAEHPQQTKVLLSGQLIVRKSTAAPRKA